MRAWRVMSLRSQRVSLITQVNPSQVSSHRSGTWQTYCLFAAFDIIKEDKVYQRYFTLYDRRIRFPSSKERPVSCVPSYLCCAGSLWQSDASAGIIG